jgi:hypothetical protein
MTAEQLEEAIIWLLDAHCQSRSSEEISSVRVQIEETLFHRTLARLRVRRSPVLPHEDLAKFLQDVRSAAGLRQLVTEPLYFPSLQPLHENQLLLPALIVSLAQDIADYLAVKLRKGSGVTKQLVLVEPRVVLRLRVWTESETAGPTPRLRLECGLRYVLWTWVAEGLPPSGRPAVYGEETSPVRLPDTLAGVCFPGQMPLSPADQEDQTRQRLEENAKGR